MNNENLGERIVMFRAKNRLTILDFANLCGVSGQTISQIELGNQKPNRVTLAKINFVLEGGESNEG